MKNFADYFTEIPLCVSEVGRVWAMVLAENIKDILIADNEYFFFSLYFMNKFPYNWNGKKFMGVNIHRTTCKKNKKSH